MHFQSNIVCSRPAKRRPGRPRKDSSQRQIVVSSKTQPLNESTLETEQSYNPQSQSLLITADDSIYRQLILKSQSTIQTEPLQLIMTNSIRIKREMLDSNPEDVTVEQVLDLRKSNNKEKTCTWCGKTGDFQEKGAHKDFCSDICFDQYRRDSFKKRSACIWCSSTSAQQFILSSANVDESKFCSPQCLAQFKVRVFCEETSAHLDQLKDVNLPEGIKDLITPELWLHNSSNGSGKRSASSLNGTSEGLYSSSTVGGQSAGGILTALSRVSPSLSSNSGGKTMGPRSILSTQGGSSGTSSSPSSFVSQNLGGLGSTQATSILGGAPLRKRGRTVAKSTVTSQQRSPNENLSTRAGNPNPSSHLHSPPILNFSTALREKHSRFNARRGGGGGVGVGGGGTNSSAMSMSVSAALQNPMISSFPGINSPMMNKTFPLTGFPFAPPFPHQSPNSRFHMETGGMNSTRQDGGGGSHPVSNSSLLSPSTKIHIPLPVPAPAPIPADRKHSLKSPSYMGSHSDKTERSHTSQLGSSLASLAGLFSSESFLSRSFPPITMLVPIPLPIPIPIPIPIPVILNSNFMKNSLNSRKSENTTNEGGIDLLISCSDNNNTDPSNANNTKTNNSGRDSSDNGRSDKLKIRGQIIDVDEND